MRTEYFENGGFCGLFEGMKLEYPHLGGAIERKRNGGLAEGRRSHASCHVASNASPHLAPHVAAETRALASHVAARLRRSPLARVANTWQRR